MGVLERLKGLLSEDEEPSYHCISCGTGYETDRSFCPTCGSQVERR